MPVAERTCADAVVDGEAIFRVIIGIDKELAGTACSQADSSFRPIVECADDCLDFLEPDLTQPCCIKTGASCPDADSPVRCCYEVDNPNSAGDPCQVIFDTMGNASDTCR